MQYSEVNYKIVHKFQEEILHFLIFPQIRLIDSSLKFTEKLRHNLDRGKNLCYYMTEIIQVVKISGTICISGKTAGMRFFLRDAG